jgi:hypothetical protein
MTLHDDSSPNDARIKEASDAVAVYGSMLTSFVVGQLVGIGVDLAVAVPTVAVPAACSIALEALVGARVVVMRTGRRQTWRDLVRVSSIYEATFVLVSLPLAVWTVAASHAAHVVSWWTAGRLALAVLALVASIPVRGGLMLAFSPRRS